MRRASDLTEHRVACGVRGFALGRRLAQPRVSAGVRGEGPAGVYLFRPADLFTPSPVPAGAWHALARWRVARTAPIWRGVGSEARRPRATSVAERLVQVRDQVLGVLQ